MRIRSHNIEFNRKKQKFAALICIGLCMPVFAQTTPPPLPAIDGVPALTPLPLPGATSMPLPLPGAVTTPSTKPIEKTAEAVPLDPGLAKIAAANAPKPLADLPAPAVESSDPAKPVAAAAPVPAPSDPSVPVLPMPPGATAQANIPPPLDLSLPPLNGAASLSAATANAGKAPLFTKTLPEVNVGEKKPQPKSWETKLAVASTPMKTSFNYRRQLLPGYLYRAQYDEQNKHLPVAVTRQDYDNLLFASVTRNDVQTTRALLNAGTDINARDSEGNTPLAAARAAGAQATAALLVARGAQL